MMTAIKLHEHFKGKIRITWMVKMARNCYDFPC